MIVQKERYFFGGTGGIKKNHIYIFWGGVGDFVFKKNLCLDMTGAIGAIPLQRELPAVCDFHRHQSLKT